MKRNSRLLRNIIHNETNGATYENNQDWFTDIYPDTNPTNNVIYNILKERYYVEIIDTSIPENRDKVEYLIYSVNGKRYLDFNCVRIFATGENLVPEFNLCDYAVGFEHMSFGDRFFRLPIYFWELYRQDFDALGYCTEKLMQAFAAGNVPIYWGDPTAVEQFNDKAFINCCGLTIDEAVANVKEVDNDDQLYLQMLSEKPLLDDQLREKTMEEFKKFIYNIFDQTPEEAKRIPTQGKMAVYNDAYRKLVRRDEMLRNNKLTMLIGKILAKKKL